MKLPTSLTTGGLLCATAVNLVSLAPPTLAQVVPDATLGAESSVVTPLDANTDRIDGGALRNNLLFHSFDTFNIPEDHGTYFANPDAVNTIFSRVTGTDPSLLFGTLGVMGDADLMFINPNGILFGPNAQLDLRGAFTATTASEIVFPGGETFSAIAPEAAPLLTINVQAPVGVVFEGETPAAIVNQGSLAVDSGQALTLSAGTLANFGSINAPEGNVVFEAVEGSGPGEGWLAVDDSTLESLGLIESFYGAELRQDDAGNLRLQGPGGYVLNQGDVTSVAIDVDARTLVNNGVLDVSGLEGGSIEARLQYWVNQGDVLANGSGGDGGTILVDASERILQTASAVTSATGVNGGEIRLDANEGGSVLSGTVIAAASTGIGGRVEMLGDSPNLAGTVVDVSGDAGGGEILLGGDYQGQGEIPTAQDTLVNESAVLTADARVNGDGGRVILWADGTTRFGGEISARGGELGGDGGFVEVSGREGGIFAGFVDAGASMGEAGTLLLDPKNITISDSESVPILQTFADVSASSIAVNESNVVVGSAQDSSIAERAGAVYIFDLDGSLQSIVRKQTPQAGDLFGFSVAIEGDNVLIGTPLDITGILIEAPVSNPSSAQSGEAYLHSIERNSGFALNNPDPLTADRFGFSVAIEDGNIIVGAPIAGLNRAGRVYVFDQDGNFRNITLENPDADIFGDFGHSVHTNGTEIIVGAPGAGPDDLGGPGRAYLFNNAGLFEGVTFFPETTSISFGDEFGSQVYIDDERVVIGSPLTGDRNLGEIYLFDRNGNIQQIFSNLTPPTFGIDFYGTSVAVDSNTIVAGSSSGGTTGVPGEVDIIIANRGLVRSISDPESIVQGNFGGAVAIDGDNIFVGGTTNSGQGIVYLFSPSIFSQPSFYEAAAGESFVFDADLITWATDNGTNVVLQANNDVTIDEPIVTNNASGRGGSITLQAGRSLLVNANILTDNGNLTLFANDTLANGVVDEFRDPGAAEILMSPGTTIDVGFGEVKIVLDDGEGLTNNDSSGITLTNINAAELRVESTGNIVSEGVLTVANDVTFMTNLGSNGDITLNSLTAGVLEVDSLGQIDNQGTVTVTGDVTLATSNAANGNIALNNLTAGILEVNSSGQIENQETVTVTEDATLTTNNAANGNIVLNNLTARTLEVNSLGQIDNQGTVTVTGNATTIFTTNNAVNGNITLNNLTAETLKVDSLGQIDNQGTVTATGNAAFTTTNTANGNITLNNLTATELEVDSTGLIDHRGTLNVTDVATFTTTNTANGNITLNNLTATDLEVNAAGVIEGEGVLTIAEDAQFISNAANEGAGSVIINNTGSTTVGNSIIGGNLTVNSSGPVAQSVGELLQIAGDITVTVNGEENGGLNNMVGISESEGRTAEGDFIKTGVGTIFLEPQTVNGNLIVNSIPLAVVSFNEVLKPSAITLDNPNNTFDGTVRFRTAISDDADIVEGTPGITQTGPLTVLGETRLNAELGNISLEEPANQFNGVAFNAVDVALVEQDGLNLLRSDATGNFSVTTGGLLTQSDRLNIEGNTELTTTLSGKGDVTLTNTIGTTIGQTLIGGNFVLRSDDPIEQVPGTTLQFPVTREEDIDINFEALGFNLGSLPPTLVSLADGEIIITAVGPIDIAQDTVTTNNGQLALFSTSSNTQQVPSQLTINSLTEALQFKDILNGDAIVLESDNTFVGAISIRTDAETIATETGIPAITQSESITVDGAAIFNAAGGSITLREADNQFGSISFEGDVVALREADSTVLDEGTATMSLSLISGESVTQLNPLQVSGPTRIESLQAGADITLDEQNQLAGEISLVTLGEGDVILSNILSETLLAETSVGNDLTVTSGGSIRQSGALTVAGTTTLNAGGSNISLPENNDFNRLTVSGGSNVLVNDVTALDLGDSATFGDFTVTSVENITTGDIAASSGDIILISSAGRIDTTAGTLSARFPSGDGGDVRIAAPGNLRLGDITASGLINGSIGLETDGRVLVDGSDIRSTISGPGVGKDIDITANRVTIRNGGRIITATVSDGTAGNVTVDTGQLLINEGQTNFTTGISTETLQTRSGEGGDITINASEQIQLRGREANIAASGFANGNIKIETDGELIVNGGNVESNIQGPGIGNGIDITADVINIRNGGRVNASTTFDGAAGDVTIDTRQLLIQGSQTNLTTGINTNTRQPNSGEGGDITINASEQIQLRGREANITASGFVNGAIKLATDGELIVDSGDIESTIFGPENGNNIAIAADVVSLRNGGRIIASTEFNSTNKLNGRAGDVDIDTRQLLIQGVDPTGLTPMDAITGIGTDPIDDSSGNGGNITINASELIRIIGPRTEEFSPLLTDPTAVTDAGLLRTGLTASSLGTGAPGDINLNTDRLIIRDGAGIATVALRPESNADEGGDINIRARKIEFRGLAGLATATLGEGAAGDITIRGRGGAPGEIVPVERLSLYDGSVITADAVPDAAQVISQLFGLPLPSNIGDTQPTRAGDIDIAADSILLDNRSRITTSSTTGDGGTITLRDIGIIQLRRGKGIGGIFTDGGAGEDVGNGGGISITADAILAVAQENTDISARAFIGRGGGININLQRPPLGIEFRPDLTPLSDITAGSDQGPPGTVNIDAVGLDPTQGTDVLPEEPRGPEVIESCAVVGNVEAAEFFDYGSGGRLPAPEDPITIESIIANWIPLDLADTNTALTVEDLQALQAPDVERYLFATCGLRD